MVHDLTDPKNAILAIHNNLSGREIGQPATPRALKTRDRRILLRELKEAGCLQVRHSSEIIAGHLGVSRATV